jgi:outer membrane protein
MMIIKTIFLGAAALFSSLAHAMDLVEVYREAQTQDSQFASARATYKAGLEKLPQGRALLFPSINFSANTTDNETDTTFRSENLALSGGNQRFNTNNYTVTLTQPVYNWSNFVQYQEGKIAVTQAEAVFGSAMQDLILRAAQAYFDVLGAQDNLSFAIAQKEAIGEQLAQAKRNFEVGTATIVDTYEAQARYDLTTSQEVAAANDLEIKKRALQVVIGKLPASLKPLASGVTLSPPEPNDMDAWVNDAMENSWQIKAQLASADFAAKEVERNRAGHHPTLDVVASYTDSSSSGNATFGVGSDATSSQIGLEFKLPLFAGGGVSSRVREAEANREKALQDLETARRDVAQRTREAYLGVTSGIAQVKALEQALISNQSSLDSTKVGRDVGVRTGVDVLNAQQLLYSAKRDLSQARYTTILNELKLKSAVGKLGEEDLAQINALLADQ